MEHLQTINGKPITRSLLVDDISDADIKKMMSVIAEHFGYLTDRNVEDYFGLPYTSSGSFAGLWNTNIEQVYDGNKYVQGFALTETGDVVLLADERDETEHFYCLGNIRSRAVKTIDVQGKEWYDRVNGNSYFSARVTINFGMDDTVTLFVPYQYGYGDQYLYAAKQVLEQNGYLASARESLKALSLVCSDHRIILRYNKEERCTKREMKAWGEA